MTNDQLEEVTRLYTKVAEQTTEIAQLKAYAQETALALHRQGAEIERLQKREAQFAAALYAVNPKRYSVVLDPEGGDPMEFDIEGSWVRFDEIEHLQKCLSEALELCRQTTFDDGAISKWEWDQRYMVLKAHTAAPDAHQQWKCANSHVRGDDPNCPVCFPFEPSDDLGTQIYALLVRRGYAQHEAHLIANGPGCTSDCVQKGYPDIDCPEHGSAVKSNPAQVATTDYGPAFVAICQWHDCRSTMAEGDAYFCPTHRELAIRNSAPSAAVVHVSEPSNEGSSAATVGAGPPSQRTNHAL